MVYKYREVRGTFTALTPDTTDADERPNIVPLAGSVVLTPIYKDGGISFSESGHFDQPQPKPAAIDPDGILRSVVTDPVTGAISRQPLFLPVTVDERANQEWTYEASFPEVVRTDTGERVNIPTKRFAVEPGDGPLNLVAVATTKHPGMMITKGAPGAGLLDISAANGEITFSWDNGLTTTIDVPDAAPGPPGVKGDPGDVRFEGIDPGITVRTDDVLIGDVTVPSVGQMNEKRWIRRTIGVGENADDLMDPGEYWVGWSASQSLANDWGEAYGSTGFFTVHAPDQAYKLPTQERYVGATLSGLPVRRATRTLLADGNGWTEWVPEAGPVNELRQMVLDRTVPPVSAPDRIVAFGDSQTTVGSGGTGAWTDHLAAKLGSGYHVTNSGFAGATVDEIMLRAGVRPIRVTLAAPLEHNGSATVTPVGEHALAPGTRIMDLRYHGGSDGTSVRINVFDGRWDLYNWTRETIPAGTIELSPLDQHRGTEADTAVIWLGGNDRTYQTKGGEETVADHIVAGVQEIMDWLTPRRSRVLLMGMQPRAHETTGTQNHELITEVNERLRSMYPGNFRSVFAYLQGAAITDMGLTPTPEDVAAVEAGILPPSVCTPGDINHINPEAARVIGEYFVHGIMEAKGWV